MTSEDGLFSGLFARGEAGSAASERAFLQAMLDFEVALMNALARAGLAPAGAAEELRGVADAAEFDLAEIGRGVGEKGTPVPALLSALRDRLSDEASAHLHTGATSQDVVDTAAMLVARRALEPIIADLTDAADACAGIAREHRETLAPGRTLLQQALPVTLRAEGGKLAHRSGGRARRARPRTRRGPGPAARGRRGHAGRARRSRPRDRRPTWPGSFRSCRRRWPGTRSASDRPRSPPRSRPPPA